MTYGFEKRLGAIARAIAIATTFSALLVGNVSAEPTKIVAAYGQTSIYNAPMWIAKEKGLFEKYGLDAELIQLTGSRITQGLLAGSAQFIASSASSTFLARLSGGDTLLIGSTLNRLPWDVIGTDAVADVSDLKGKTGALALRGDFTETAMRIAFNPQGIDIGRDVTLVQGFGTDAERIAALASGSAQFTIVNSDFRSQYEEAGLKRLISLMELDNGFILSGIFTSREYADEHPDVVKSYLHAINDALQIMRTNKDYTVEIAAKYSNRDAAEIAPTYDFYASAMQKSVEVTQDAVEASLLALEGANASAATANPKDFYEPEFVEALKSEGSIQ